MHHQTRCAKGHDLSAPRGLLRSGECAECSRIYNRRSYAKRKAELEAYRTQDETRNRLRIELDTARKRYER